MAKIKSFIELNGSLENLTAYRMRGVEGIIVRRKGGATRDQILTSPRFANTRKVNAEFGARAKMAKNIMSVLRPIGDVADYMVHGTLNGFLQPVQELDTESPFGKRNILLSDSPTFLDGFPLNRTHPFESIVRASVNVSFDRPSMEAKIQLPNLMPGINFFVPANFPFFRFEAVLGIVPDLLYSEAGYKATIDFHRLSPAFVSTLWMPTAADHSATELHIRSSYHSLARGRIVIVGLAIRFGVVNSAGLPTPAKREGSAKIVRGF